MNNNIRKINQQENLLGINCMDNRIKEFINLWVGKRLESIHCACEILDFGFSGDFVLHGMGLTRVVLNDDIIITTLDYNSWDQTDPKNNDEWYNKDKYKDQIIGGIVKNIRINKFNDLLIEMDNGVRIECYVANSYPHYEEEFEQWLLFEHTKDSSGRFLTAYNKRLSFD